MVLDSGRGGERGPGNLVRGFLCFLLALGSQRLGSVSVGVCRGNASGGLLLCLLGRDSGGRDLVLGPGWDNTLVFHTALELFFQILVLTGQPTQFNDNLVQEVVDLMFIVATTELSRGEILVEDILGHERHVVTSVDSFGGPHYLISDPRKTRIRVSP